MFFKIKNSYHTACERIENIPPRIILIYEESYIRKIVP